MQALDGQFKTEMENNVPLGALVDVLAHAAKMALEAVRENLEGDSESVKPEDFAKAYGNLAKNLAKKAPNTAVINARASELSAAALEAPRAIPAV